MKALELLKADRDFCQSINNDKSIAEQYDEAISEIHTLLMYKNLADTYLKIDKCKCGILKIQGHLCSDIECTDDV